MLLELAGKTTSALNRPKTTSDKKTSSSRKTHGNVDDDNQFTLESEEEDVPSKEKDKDSEEIEEPPEQSVFREVSEVRFPAEVGPLGTHRLCKIKCIDGMWQGPLCAAPDQEEAGQLKFEPLYKRCVVDQIPPHLLLSYKNVSVVSCKVFHVFHDMTLIYSLHRRSTGIYLMDTRFKHVARISAFTSL